MTAQEKRLLRIALVIFLGYLLPFQAIPAAYNFYRSYLESVEDLRTQIDRYEKLGERAEYWETENKRAKQLRDQIEKGLLPGGNNRDLVGAKMQGLVRQLAQSAGITFKSLEPPDSFGTGKWVLVVQSMQFEANSQTLMKFLQAVDKAQVNLAIASLEVRSYRNRLSGTIKLTGFSGVVPEKTS